MNKNWISLLIISGLTLALVFFWDSTPEALLGGVLNNDKPEKARHAGHPSIIVADHVSQHFNESGRLNHLFLASEVRHYQINPKRQTPKDFTEITKPRLTLFRDNAPPWKITADQGHSNRSGETFTLTGNVMVWQVNPETGEKSELTTSKLVVKPDDQYATTDKPVMILAPDSTTSAVGMKAFLDQDKISLLSRVRGTYEAP